MNGWSVAEGPGAGAGLPGDAEGAAAALISY